MKKLILLITLLATLVVSNTFAQNGIITSICGDGTWGVFFPPLPATTAQLTAPRGVAVDRLGNVYFTQSSDNNVYVIDTLGILSVYSCCFSIPVALCLDNNRNLYVTDYFANEIKKVDTSGVITIIAGGGTSTSENVPATSAVLGLSYSAGLVVDHSGNVYISYGNKVRKINTSGIITTIAGTGVFGFSGDSGPATAAVLADPGTLAIDDSDNIYIGDNGNLRIRKINSSGIISTFAGTGIRGMGGDGSLATNAQFIRFNQILIDRKGNVLIADTMRIREISIFDGKISTIAGISSSVTGGDGSFAANASLGIDAMAIDGLDNIYIADTSYEIRKITSSATIQFYNDRNVDCLLDSGDIILFLPLTVEVDSNGHSIDTVSTIGSFSYFTKGNISDVYSFKCLPSTLISPYCPNTGILYDTIFNRNSNYYNKNLGFICTSATNYDLGMYVSSRSGYHAEELNIYVYKDGCETINPILSMNFNPNYNFISSYPSPSSVIGHTVTWDLSPYLANYPYFIYVRLDGGTKSIGDTVLTTGNIMPVTGDINPSNNYCVIVDTVRSGYDPNEMSVIPSGRITPGVVTQLEYTIQFENTGNDTAFHIFVIDTLSNYLNPQSLRLEMASAFMNTTRITSGTGTAQYNIVKFDFPNINLLDSSHHGYCDGMIKYTINTKPGLPAGTNIYNHAGIYFDFNPVVVTNKVLDYMAWPTTVSNTKNTTKVDIYPNPANTQLNIITEAGVFSSVLISNVFGQAVASNNSLSTNTKIDVSALPNGIYTIILKGENGIEVRKFVKM